MIDIDKYLFKSDVDPETHIIATYHISAKPENIRSSVKAIAIGQSIGNPDVRTERDSPEIMDNHLAKIIELKEQGKYSFNPTIAKIAYPIANYNIHEDGITQLLCTLMGGQMDIDIIQECKLVELDLPDYFKSQFKGPKYGIDEIKERTKAIDRPLLGGIVKPKTGLNINQLEEMVADMIEGGVDFIKEDEVLGDPECCRFKDRIPRIAKLVNELSKKQGREIFYAPCINADPPFYAERAKFASDNGHNTVHLNFWAGLGAYRHLRDMDLNTAIFFQKSGDKILTDKEHRFSISWPVVCQLARMSGADFIHAGMWGGYLSDTKEDLDKTFTALMGGNTYKGTIPSLSCGSNPGLVDTTVKNYGTNLMMNAGGAIQGHPMGTRAGAIAMRQAMDKPLSVNMDEYMQDKPELKSAIEKWGYIDPDTNKILYKK
jgi:ribulose-bisphosphate carboxylase large chain